MNRRITLLLGWLFLVLPLCAAEPPRLGKNLEIGKGVRVVLVERAFDAATSKIDRCRTDEYVCRINGEVPFGVDGTIPQRKMESITLYTKGHRFRLNSAAMYDAWGDRPVRIKGIKYMTAVCIDPQNCIVRGLFGDAAGTFVAEWLVQNGTPRRSIISNSPDVVRLFKTRLDPPDEI